MSAWEGWQPISRISRRTALAFGVVLVVVAGGALEAQKVVGPEEFDRAMKTIDTAIKSVHQSVASTAYEDAKAPLALARQMLASTRPVWEVRGEAEAVQLNRDAVATLDALDEALSAIVVDPTAVAAAVDHVSRACDSCHATFREGDEQTGYRFKSAAR